MAEALQHSQAALIARLSTTGATDDEPVPDTARSGRANAIVSPSRWYKKSVRSRLLVYLPGFSLLIVGLIARYSEKIPSSTCLLALSKSALLNVSSTLSGGAQAAIESQ